MTAQLLTIQPRKRLLSARGLETRRKLLDAAIAVLGEQGYGATSTQTVAERAAVSRGSMLHQFQTRLDLMIATAERAMDRTMEESRSRFFAIDDPIDAIERYPDILWRAQNEAPAIALTEILLAARWDPGLAERLVPIAERTDRIIRAEFSELVARCGAEDLAGLLTHVRALIAATRGLAIELMFDRDRETPQLAWESLKRDYLEFVRARLPAKSKE